MAVGLGSERTTATDRLVRYAVQGDNPYASPAHQRPGAPGSENDRATESADRARRRKTHTGTVDEKLLREIIRRIVEAVAPEKIILFGSGARGEMGPDSDLDLLIVKSGVHRLATAQMIEHSLVGIPIPTDIVVATPKDIEVHKDTIGLIYRPALQAGKILYAV